MRGSSFNWKRIFSHHFFRTALAPFLLTGFGTATICHQLDSHSDNIQTLRNSQCILPHHLTNQGVIIATGNGNKILSEEIAGLLGLKLSNIQAKRFNDGESNIEINEDVTGKTVYIVQPTCFPVNENLMELLLMISTIKRSGAAKVIAILPYYGYARQDRESPPRNGVFAADVAHMLDTMGVDEVLTLDLHSTQTIGFLNKARGKNLDGTRIGVDYFLKNKSDLNISNPIVVSPDAGGYARAKRFLEDLKKNEGWQDIKSAMLIKHRTKPGLIDESFLIGKVEDGDCIVVDDMVDTGGTILKAAEELKSHGAKQVFIYATHGLLNGNFF